MSKFKKIRTIIILILVVSFFAIYNIVWYLNTQKMYKSYTIDMEKQETNTYVYFDTELYGYVVSTPTYLHFDDGSLSVTDSKSGMSLIIWPQGNDEYMYGVRVEYQNEGYEIEMKADQTPKNPNDRKIVEANERTISTLFEKANSKWKIQ